MKWAEITLKVLHCYVETASAVLTESGCPGVVVHDPNAVSSDPFADWFGKEPRLRSGRSVICTVSGYMPVDDRLEAALSSVKERLHLAQEYGLDLSDEISVRTVDDVAWADAWKAYFKPQRIGRFVVKPTWEPWESDGTELVIEIDPGMAFGSGAHPTTRLCLTVIEEIVRPGWNVLDWGTGSGILSIGAARLGASAVTALDLDPVAVEVARANVEQNELGGVIRTTVGSIELLPVESQYDLIIANIVADPIITGAPEIARRLRPGGRAILSGIIDRREAEVAIALEGAGLRLVRTECEEDWRALLVERT